MPYRSPARASRGIYGYFAAPGWLRSAKKRSGAYIACGLRR